MLAHSFAILVLASFSLSTLDADVTARYKTEITINPATAAMTAGAVKGAELAAPQETGIRLKNGKGFSSSSGFSSIIDFPAKELTVLDHATMRYAKMTSAQFVEEAAKAIPEMPADARSAMAATKISLSAPRLTGRTATIQGVEAEEREIVVSSAYALAVRMVMQLWTAKASEVQRVPAIRELTEYSLYTWVTTNPVSSMEKIIKPLPGFGSVFQPIMEEMKTWMPILRVHMDVFMPGSAGLDNSAPFFQINQELVELSTAPVPDGVFEIPAGYQEASPSELVQALWPRPGGVTAVE